MEQERFYRKEGFLMSEIYSKYLSKMERFGKIAYGF